MRIVSVIIAPALSWLVYHVWKDRQRPEPVALLVAALAHGLYDFLMLAPSPWVRPVPASIILAIWIWRMRLVRGLQGEQTTGTR